MLASRFNLIQGIRLLSPRLPAESGDTCPKPSGILEEREFARSFSLTSEIKKIPPNANNQFKKAPEEDGALMSRVVRSHSSRTNRRPGYRLAHREQTTSALLLRKIDFNAAVHKRNTESHKCESGGVDRLHLTRQNVPPVPLCVVRANGVASVASERPNCFLSLFANALAGNTQQTYEACRFKFHRSLAVLQHLPLFPPPPLASIVPTH